MLSGEIFLVTGATGRLGCELVPRLEELGANVVPLVLDGYPLKPKRVKWTAKSQPIVISDPHDLKKLQTPDFVINFHWHVNRALSFTDQLLYELEHNIHRLVFLWDWLADKLLQRFINISSINVFSHLNKNPISWDAEPLPVSPYGIAKVAAERLFDAYFRNSAFSVIHLRLCSVASFGEHPSHLMSQLYHSAFENRPIRINTGHTSYIIYIDEAIDLIINATLAANQFRYLLLTNGNQNDQIALKFEQISGRRLNADFVNFAPSVCDPIFVTDIQKLRTHWTRITPLESIIEKIINLHRRNSNSPK